MVLFEIVFVHEQLCGFGMYRVLGSHFWCEVEFCAETSVKSYPNVNFTDNKFINLIFRIEVNSVCRCASIQCAVC